MLIFLKDCSYWNSFIPVLMCYPSVIRHRRFLPSDCHTESGQDGPETSANGGKDSAESRREPVIAEGQGTDRQRQNKETRRR